ncbi:MAG: DUF1559 domain-containing protein, partial [Proteobacteria bacterium]|nr:DUF1559 domain-containing protein [Pseudomonadota bacterium]
GPGPNGLGPGHGGHAHGHVVLAELRRDHDGVNVIADILCTRLVVLQEWHLEFDADLHLGVQQHGRVAKRRYSRHRRRLQREQRRRLPLGERHARLRNRQIDRLSLDRQLSRHDLCGAGLPMNATNSSWPKGGGECYSFHPGGINVVFGDSSTRFISETIDITTFCALVTRAGGEIAGEVP